MNEDYADIIDELKVDPSWLNQGQNAKSKQKTHKPRPNLSYVIRGKHKRKKIPAPFSEDHQYEITPQKIKESVFQIIDNHNHNNWSRSVFFDGFAGSGQMGFEAVSLEARLVYLFEKSKTQAKQLKDFFFKNQVDNAKILAADFIQVLTRFLRQDQEVPFLNTHLSENHFCILYLDPPYEILLDKLEVFSQIVGKLAQLVEKMNSGELLIFVQAPSLKSSFFQGNTKKRREQFALLEQSFDKSYLYGKNQIFVKFCHPSIE